MATTSEPTDARPVAPYRRSKVFATSQDIYFRDKPLSFIQAIRVLAERRKARGIS